MLKELFGVLNNLFYKKKVFRHKNFAKLFLAKSFFYFNLNKVMFQAHYFTKLEILHFLRCRFQAKNHAMSQCNFQSHAILKCRFSTLVFVKYKSFVVHRLYELSVFVYYWYAIVKL